MRYNVVEVEKMFYDGNNPILRIVGVEHMVWEAGVFDVKPRNYSALAFRISGDAVIGSGKKQYFAGTNDIVYLPQNMAYAAQYSKTEILVVHFVTADDDKEIEIYACENSEKIYKMFLHILSLWKNKAAGYTVYSLAQVYAVLGEISEKQTIANLPKPFLRAVSYIHSNYRNSELNIDMICREADSSATAFRRLFRKYYRKTPVTYITELRIEYARNLISGGMCIEQAALESGFNDAKYFVRVVKKYCHCTPREFKNYGR